MTLDTQLSTRQVGNILFVDVAAANVDFRNAETLKSTVSSLIHDASAPNVVLNLDRVGFMDSSGLSALLFCKRMCEEANGRFSLCSLQAYVFNLIKLTNLNKSVSVYNNEADVLANQ